jgi:hypothetical protein
VRFAVRSAPNTLSPLHSEVLRIMAATEPAKFAQLAAGLIPREALLTVAQRLPGKLEGEDWELMLSVCAAIKQALPSANQRQNAHINQMIFSGIEAGLKIFIIDPLGVDVIGSNPSLPLNPGCPQRRRGSAVNHASRYFSARGQHPTVYLTTNLFRSVIHDADLNTNCALRPPRLNKANELSPGFYLFLPQQRYFFPKT